MNKYTLIASFALTSLVAATSTSFAQTSSSAGFSKTVPIIAGEIPAAPLYFSTHEDAEQALTGYNYVLKQLDDGRTQAIVSGLNGSGLQNPWAALQAASQKSLAKAANPPSSETETPFPSIVLKEKLNGQAAIEALGAQLPSVAKAYDMSAERLEDILRTDSSAWIDEGGRLLYIEADTKPVVKPQATASGNLGSSAANATAATGPTTFSSIASSTTDAFALHSKPDSNRVIYLDFNGHSAVNTAWYNGTLTAQAYDTDGNPAAFSATELNNIREIWQRVAEDYAPFDVDVTTQEPPADKLQRTSISDIQYGTRAVITRSMAQLCSQSCGGVAYVNVFSYYSSTTPDRYRPAWIFFDKLGNGYPKYVAEAVSHEVGHNLNLSHDGTSTVAYYAGQGSGATGWAPIMGVGYYKPVTQWSKGEYPNANNFQDDVTVINSAGTPLRTDDYPNTTASAAPLAGDPSAVSQAGIIERRTDADVFTFHTDGGNAQFNVTSGSVASNLDISLTLTDSNGATIATVNPSTSLTATLTANLTAGNYFLKVDGVGYGDLVAGYSDYASLGQYVISGSYPMNAAPAAAAPTLSTPVAVVSALPTFGDSPLTVAFNGGGSSDQDGSIVAYDWSFGDGTPNGAAATVSHVYNTPGNYTATLTVTDNSGLKSSAAQTINVTQAPAAVNMKVGSTTITRRLLSKGRSQCIAKVTVNYGASTVAGATVYGTWSGSVKTAKGYTTVIGATSGKTASTGSVNFSSVIFPSSSAGTCSFKVGNVVKSGYTYDGSGQIVGSYSW